MSCSKTVFTFITFCSYFASDRKKPNTSIAGKYFFLLMPSMWVLHLFLPTLSLFCIRIAWVSLAALTYLLSLTDDTSGD